MTKDEALKLALEALEGVLDDAPKVLDASIAGGLYEVVQCRDAITAIKAALAQPAAQAERQPLSDEEIYSLADSLEIWNEDDEEWILDPNTFARAIEAAHGIKENT